MNKCLLNVKLFGGKFQRSYQLNFCFVQQNLQCAWPYLQNKKKTKNNKNKN